MEVALRKGWFIIEGYQDGDRTLAEQMLGIEPALAECKGKTVLDLGCAEGLIGREFARAGANVLGVELLPGHVEAAEEACKGMPNIRFICKELSAYIAERPNPEQFDIVLSLGIAHKLKFPGVLTEFAARSARNLLLFRAPAKGAGGIVTGKHSGIECHVPTIMEQHGFQEEKIIEGVRGESVQYWRKVGAG